MAPVTLGTGQRAFAPGSVTTVFAPSDDHEGSPGVSFAVADDITATVAPPVSVGVSGTDTAIAENVTFGDATKYVLVPVAPTSAQSRNF